jgi:ubiquinol-cytochrome c reductase iron-sulfur subunit
MASNEATIPTGTHGPEGTRRDFLYIATGTAAAVGAAAVLVPLIAQMNPDASTLAAGGPVDLDVSKIEAGQQVVVRWRERPIFVFRRTPETLKTLEDPSCCRCSPIPSPSRCSSRPTRPTQRAR